MTIPRVKNKRQTVAAIEAELLKRVRVQGHISRVELARELKIVPSTAGIYVDRLVSEGFLRETQKAERDFGRPPTLLSLNPDGGRFVGVDFEARNIMATAVDFSQQPLRQVHKTIRSTDTIAQILEKIEDAIREVVHDDLRPVLGIGVGVPGIIDPHSGVAVHYEFIKGWQDIPLAARLQQKFSVPVFLENNIRCMALAEMWFGQGRGLQNFVCVGVRTGIAAGVIAQGQLLRGANNQAGEIGHWSCPVPTELSAAVNNHSGHWNWEPGARLEQVASISALLAKVQPRMNPPSPRQSEELSLADLLQAARAGDSNTMALVRAVARVHGWAVCQLNALFNPQTIIFSGPLTELGELYLSPIRESARQWGGADVDALITASPLGQYNGAVGAAALALHQWKPNR